MPILAPVHVREAIRIALVRDYMYRSSSDHDARVVNVPDRRHSIESSNNSTTSLPHLRFKPFLQRKSHLLFDPSVFLPSLILAIVFLSLSVTSALQ